MKKFLIFALLGLIVYSRFVGLDWGLPYPMHPDERNIVIAIERLHCDFSTFTLTADWLKQCFNPEFFAYGQPPIFAAYVLSRIWQAMDGTFHQPISFVDATLALRFLSALASVMNVWILYKIFQHFAFLWKKEADTVKKYSILSIPLLALTPYFVQFSHFGTTESLLMLLYSSIVYFSLKLVDRRHSEKVDHVYVISVLGLLVGFSVAVKISSVLFCAVPLLSLLFVKLPVRKKAFYMCYLGFITILTAAVFSLHSLIHWSDFIGSMSYETNVGRGLYKAFYTRQFEFAIPFLFQVHKVLPYVFGLPQLLLILFGFVMLPWKNRSMLFLRATVLLFLVPTLFLYAKWTRFLAPVFPIMTLFAALALLRIVEKIKISQVRRYVVFLTVVMVCSLQGIAYMRIYQDQDVRFQASEWIYSHIPEGSKILSETANVIDIPMPTAKNPTYYHLYPIVSFDFYNMDANAELQSNLKEFVDGGAYIFVPSRRIFSNHTCLKTDTWEANTIGYTSSRCAELTKTYPLLNDYYAALFSEKLGYRQVAKFTSYPRIELFGWKIFEFPDEGAEETWTVFDHPVIRIYQKAS